MRIILLPIIIFTSLIFHTNAFAHCDLAYVSKGRLQSVSVSESVVARRTSVRAAENNLAQRSGVSPENSSGYAGLTSEQVRTAMPPNDGQADRQNQLTYWLLFIRKLFEEEKYKDVAKFVQMMRHQRMLLDEEANIGSDDGDATAEGHFSTSNITRLILAYEKPSILQIESKEGFGNRYFSALKQALYSRWFNRRNSNISPILRLGYFDPLIPPTALIPAGEYITVQSTKKRWMQLGSISKFSGMLGLTSTRGSISDLYLTEGETVFSISVDKSDNSITYDSALTCQNQIDDSLRSISKGYSGDSRIVMASLVKAEDKYVLTLAEGQKLRHIFLTSDEYAKLAMGRVPDGSDGEFGQHIKKLVKSNRTIVFWSHPLMQKKGDFRDATIRFASALGRAFPKLNVAIDDPHENIPELSDKLRSLEISPDDLFVLVDVTGRVQFNEPLSDELDNLRGLLGAENVIEVDDAPPEMIKSDKPHGVIVITGHADHELEAYVDRLAAKGYFKGNYVVLQSCGAEISPKVVAKINEEYGALGTFHYPNKVEVNDAVTHTKLISTEIVDREKPEPFSYKVRKLTFPPDHQWEGEMSGAWTISYLKNWGTQYG